MSEFTTASKEGGVELWRFNGDLTSVGRLGPPDMRHFVWDASGQRIAIWGDKLLQVLHVRDDDNPTVCLELVLTKGVESVAFSNNRWVGVKLECPGENLKLGDTEGGTWTQLAIHERFGEDSGSPFHFHGNDLLCYLSPDRSLRIQSLAFPLDKVDFNTDAYRVADDITDFAVGPLRSNPRIVVVAIFRRALEAESAKISILYVDFDAKSQDNVVLNQPLGRATEVEMKWNKIGSVLLIKESAAVDQSGGSYYGSSQLYSLRTAKNADVKTIVSRSTGSVQFYGWSSMEREIFFVGYGPLPCKIEMWSAAKNAPKLHLGMDRRNHLAVCNAIRVESKKEEKEVPNLVLIGGFGNLPGDVEVWDMTAQKIIGQVKLPWTVEIEFSPDNLLLLSSTTTPRLRVDNCIKIVRYNGEPLVTREFQELYKAAWRPRPDVVVKCLDPAVGIYRQTSSKATDTGLVLRKKGGGFGGALSAALSRTTPTNASEPRKAVRASENKAQVTQIPGYAAEPSIPGAPPATAFTAPNSKSVR